MFNPTNLFFVFSVFQASYLTKPAFQAPNPDPSHATKADPMVNPTFLAFATLYANAMGLFGVAHCLFALSSSTADVFPFPLMNSDLFMWSPFTTALITIALFGGCLRLVAYSELQENFTFRLACPSRLMQSGVYGWIQHPSYSSILMLTFGYFPLILRLDGVLSCWMSGVALKFFVYGSWVYIVLSAILTFQKEEKILHDGFGREWEKYHRKTARFIPHVF